MWAQSFFRSVMIDRTCQAKTHFNDLINILQQQQIQENHFQNSKFDKIRNELFATRRSQNEDKN